MQRDWKIITNLRTLRALERAGFVTVCPQVPERHWTGAMVRSRWVQPGDKHPEHVGQRFKWRGKEYRLAYLDGCFKPFVARFEPGAQLPSFV